MSGAEKGLCRFHGRFYTNIFQYLSLASIAPLILSSLFGGLGAVVSQACTSHAQTEIKCERVVFRSAIRPISCMFFHQTRVSFVFDSHLTRGLVARSLCLI
eukprot:2130092-Rhodomonas_salina.1